MRLIDLSSTFVVFVVAQPRLYGRRPAGRWLAATAVDRRGHSPLRRRSRRKTSTARGRVGSPSWRLPRRRCDALDAEARLDRLPNSAFMVTPIVVDDTSTTAHRSRVFA